MEMAGVAYRYGNHVPKSLAQGDRTVQYRTVGPTISFTKIELRRPLSIINYYSVLLTYLSS
jgi:hypothetical protein